MQQVLLPAFMPNFLFMDVHDVGAPTYLGKIIANGLYGYIENVSDLS